jgi:hypothetical protein
MRSRYCPTDEEISKAAELHRRGLSWPEVSIKLFGRSPLGPDHLLYVMPETLRQRCIRAGHAISYDPSYEEF